MPILVHPCFAGEPASPRERVSLDDNWRFVQGDPDGAGDKLSYVNLARWIEVCGTDLSTNPAPSRPEGNPGADVVYTQPGFDDHGWRQLNLPHDWAVEGPIEQQYEGETAKLKYWGPVWYRKHFDVSTADSGRKILLDLDGAMSGSEVWLNGQLVGGWPYGYAYFELDLSPYIKFGGENILAIRLNGPEQSSRWYPGAGIYRNVWLVKTGPVHVGHWGTFVTTPKATVSEATVNIAVKLMNEADNPATVSVRNEIYELKDDGKRGKLVNTSVADGMNLPAHGGADKSSSIEVKKPRLWSITHPQRYVVVTSVEQQSKLLDQYETPFGIRTIEFTVDNGFLLNGERVKIQGVCLHADLGPLGMAFNTRAQERQLELLKWMGCNAIRTSHNPPAPELLELCDRMGFVVMAESFDCWEHAKRPGDYHLFFPAWHEKDLRALIRNDRNHPSVVMWSIGNEIYEQHDADGWRLGKELQGIVHEEDLTRPVTMAIHTVPASTNGFQKVVDVFGYNYKPMNYAQFRTDNPTIPLVGSETASCISSRGEYFFPVSEDKKLGRADFQVTSYDLSAPQWATTPDTEFKGQDKNPSVAGEFVWTGFDYLGEPTPYDRDTTNHLLFTNPDMQEKENDVLKSGKKIEVPSRSSYFGIYDLCGFAKDRVYLYQSRWRSELPMAHLVPQNWNWPDRAGKVTPVHVYTSGDSAELFLNGKSLGVKTKGPFEYRLTWNDVVYEPGALKVVATRNGKKWASDIIKTTGSATRLALKADRTSIQADGKDLAFVTLTVEDEKGLMVPNAMNHIRFTMKGPGELIATGNGDATSHVSFQSTEINAFNGLCLAIVRAKSGESGKITLEAESDGLATTAVTIRGN